MKSPISKYEAIGIFLSVAVMAMALVFLNVKTSNIAFLHSGEVSQDQGAVVVVTEEGEVAGASLAEALQEASTEKEGLQQLVLDDIMIGSGKKVEEGDVVTVHYVGRTQDGIEITNSYNTGEPFSFEVGGGRVISGWETGLLGMKVGGQRVLVIPPELGYGDRAVGPIPAGSTLVFIVELLAIDE